MHSPAPLLAVLVITLPLHLAGSGGVASGQAPPPGDEQVRAVDQRVAAPWSPASGSGFVTGGRAYDLDQAFGPQPMPPLPGGQTPRDVVGVAHLGSAIYLWFRNGTYANVNSPYASSRGFAVPPGRSPGDIVDVDARPWDGRTYMWFRDGTVSVGSIHSLTIHAVHQFTTADGKSAGSIVGVAYCDGGRVRAWYADGTYSEGTPTSLGAHAGPVAYSQHSLPTLASPPDEPLGMGCVSGDGVRAYWYRSGPKLTSSR